MHFHSHSFFCSVNISETALQLEALVGDLEDAVFCVVNRHSGSLFSPKVFNSSVATVSIEDFMLKWLG